MQYEIVSKLGGDDQVGLRLNCDSQLQAEKIHRTLRQEGFWVSRLMPNNSLNYSHFVFVTATETRLREAMRKIEVLYCVGKVEINTNYTQKQTQATENFKSWQNQFRQVVKQLNSDSLRPTSSVQEIDPTHLQQKIAAGKSTEIEEQLLQQTDDGNALRRLVALYKETDQVEEIVELCKAKWSEILALPPSGRLVEQLVSAHLQHYQQTNNHESFRAATLIAQEFIPELERLRQANGVRKLLHQSLTPQEPLPTVEGATLSEQLARSLEIEPDQRIPKLESLNRKYPKAIKIILALADSYAVTDNFEKAVELYQSIQNNQKTEEVKIRYVKLLLKTDRPQEVIELIPDSENISPALAGLRGAALYQIGQESQALPFLERAWQRNNRSIDILLPLARLWTSNQNWHQAAIAYQDLLETSTEFITEQDNLYIEKIIENGGFGDIDDKKYLSY